MFLWLFLLGKKQKQKKQIKLSCDMKLSMRFRVELNDVILNMDLSVHPLAYAPPPPRSGTKVLYGILQHPSQHGICGLT